MTKNKNGLEKDKKKKLPFNVLSKKGLAALALAGVMIASPLMLAGCSGEQGPKGNDGTNGSTWYSGTEYSASQGVIGDFFFDTDDYDIYTKTADGWTWLSNIKGATGPEGPAGNDGQNGQDGITPTITINEDGYWVINGVPTTTKAQGPAGENGQNGQNGTTPTISINNEGYWVINGEPTDVKAEAINGTNGQDGNTWSVGAEYPTAPKNGDMFLNNTTWEVYQYNGTSWESKGNIKGQDGQNGQNGQNGSNGANGQDGATWLTGTAITGTGTGISATIANSKVGDLYFNTDTCDIYQCTAENTWNWIANIKGAAGQNGNDGQTPTIAINQDGYWVINGVVTDVNAHGSTYGDVLVSNKLTISDFADKTITIFGDSITAGVGASDKTTTSYVAKLGQILGATITNKGSSGTALSTNVKGNSGEARGSRLNEIKNYKEDVDYVIIALGTNDWDLAINGDGVKLGTLGSTDTATIYGAWNVAAQALSQNYAGTNTKIYFSTPIISNSKMEGYTMNNWSSTTKNAMGYSLRDVCNAIIETAAMYDIPTLDMNILSGIYYNSSLDNNVDGTGDAMADNLHPNDVGHELMANAMATFLLDNYSYADRQNTKALTLKTRSNNYQTINVLTDQVYMLPTATKEGYIFKHWVDAETGDVYQAGSSITMDKNKQLNAVFILSTEPVVTFVDLAGGTVSENNIKLAENQTLLEACPTFTATNSEGLVPSYYTDINCTQKFDLNSTTITDHTTVYISWETDARWFTVVDGAITGFDTTTVDYDKSKVEKLILPRTSATGETITTVGTGSLSNNPFFMTFTPGFTNLKELIIPEGYTTIKSYTFSNKAEYDSSSDSAFTVKIPSTIQTLSTTFLNVNVAEYIVSEENTAFASHNGMLTDKSKAKLIRYNYASSATTFDASIFTSCDAAFLYGNKKITSLTLGSNSSAYSNMSIEGMYNLATLHLDFTISKGKFPRAVFANSWNSNKYLLLQDDTEGIIYVNSEEDKTMLINILKYDNENPILEGDSPTAEKSDAFANNGWRDKLIARIQVKSN